MAAFGVADPAIGTERLIVVAESRERRTRRPGAAQTATVERVLATAGIPPDVVVIAPPGTVLKTSSGKVRRSATREAYVRDDSGADARSGGDGRGCVSTAALEARRRLAPTSARLAYRDTWPSCCS